MVNEDKKSTILEGSITALYYFLVLFIVILGLFLFRGIERADFFEKSVFYFAIGSASVVAILALMVINYLVSIGFLDYRRFGWANLYIHNTKDSILGSVGLDKYLTVSNVIHISIVFSILVSLYAITTQTSFVALPTAEFQVSETGKIILATEPAAISETLLIVVLLSLIYGFGLWFIKQKGLPESTKYLLYFAVILLITLAWMAIHFARYGSEETSLLAVASFGFIGSLVTFVTGSVIVWYVWHVFNNLFIKMSEIFSDDTVTVVIIVFLIVYVFSVVLFKLFKRKK